MNSFGMLRKTVFCDSPIRISQLYLNKHKYCFQNLCSTADFKISKFNSAENRHAEIRSNSSNNYHESDTLGILKKSVKNNPKFSRNTQARPQKYENKTIIKIKKPRRDEADTFGNLSDKKPIWYPDINEKSVDDNDLSDDSVIVKNLSKRFRCPQRYLYEMKQLVKQKKVKDALDLFIDMRRNFVVPILPHFTYMIGVCGRVGYTEMAFKLLRQMTDRSLKPTPATLTGLFNACAESPFPEYGLKKACLLKEKIEQKNWEITQITYHAMIKAFGKCGDLLTAFKIVDEMAKADIKIDVETYSFLLMSCIANKEAGFTYAVEVWRMMKTKKCLPNVYTFNLLLRATRDCGIGPEDISCLLLQHWSNYLKRPYGFLTKENLSKNTVLKLNSSSNNHAIETEDDIKLQDNNFNESDAEENTHKYELKDVKNISNTNKTSLDSQTSVTSVLSVRPVDDTEILEILNIKTPSDRLSLLGGLEGFLNEMAKSKVKFTIKTFTLLLECLPDDILEEEKLLLIMDQYQLKPDIEFFNVLIKKRNFRHAREAARYVLVLINKYELTPDIMTFGALGLGCRHFHQGKKFIDEMKKMGSHPNIEIIGSMVRNACMFLDFPYMNYVLELMEEEQIKPDERVLSVLEKTLLDLRKNIILMEHGKEVDKSYQKEGIQDNFREFSSFYEKWLKRMKYQPEEHPWSQYKTDIIERNAKEN